MLPQIFISSLMFGFVCGYSDGSAQILKDIEVNPILEQYNDVVLYMVRRYIIQYTNTLVITEKCDFLLYCAFHQQQHLALLQHIVNNLNYSLTVQLYFGKTDDRPWDYNIFVVDSSQAFESLHFRFPETEYERQFYFFILFTLSMPDAGALNVQLLRIFNMCLRWNIKNVVIMHKNYNRPYMSFFTYRIFNPVNCHRAISVQEFNRFENGHLLEDYLFPNNMNNFNGCPIPVCGQLVEPLLRFQGDPSNVSHLQDIQRLSGIEGDILKLVSETMNIRLHMHFTNEMNMIRLYSNSTGCFGELEQQRAQIAVGGLSLLIPRSYKFTYSQSYHTSPKVFVVRSGVLFGPIKQLLNPFNNNTWYVLLLHFLVSVLIVESIERFRPPSLRNFVFGPANKHPNRSLLVTLLGNPLPTPVIPKRNFARFLLMAWLLFTFELRNGYQGKMFDSLRHAKRRPVPQKISQLIEDDYKLVTYRYSNYYPLNKTMLVNNDTDILDVLRKSEQRLTTTALLDYLHYYNDNQGDFDSLVYVKENIYFYQCVLFFPKHSILLPSFNQKLKALSDAGLTSHIAQRYVSWHHKRRVFQTRHVITNRNLRGLYTIYGILCKIAILSFILELLSKRSQTLKRFMDLLN